MSLDALALELRSATRDDLALLVELVAELAEYEGRRHEVLLDAADFAEALFGPRPLCDALVAPGGAEPAGFAIWFYSFSTFRGRANLYIEEFVRAARLSPQGGRPGDPEAVGRDRRRARLRAAGMERVGVERAGDRVLLRVRRTAGGRVEGV